MVLVEYMSLWNGVFVCVVGISVRYLRPTAYGLWIKWVLNLWPTSMLVSVFKMLHEERTDSWHTITWKATSDIHFFPFTHLCPANSEGCLTCLFTRIYLELDLLCHTTAYGWEIWDVSCFMQLRRAGIFSTTRTGRDCRLCPPRYSGGLLSELCKREEKLWHQMLPHYKN